MIQNSLQQAVTQKLNIVVTNTNKALQQVLQDTSKSEVEVLSSNKDLKSVINSIFEKTTQNESSNKQLLELVKKNPTLKNLSNVSQTLKDLKKAFDKTDTQTQKVLKPFLTHIKDITPQKLEQNFKFSGVFLESNLKESLDFEKNIKKLVTQLEKQLQPKEKTTIKKTIQNIKQEVEKVQNNFSKTQLNKIFSKLENIPLSKDVLTTLKDSSKESVLKLLTEVEKQTSLPKDEKLQKQILTDIKNIIDKDSSKPKLTKLFDKLQNTPLTKEATQTIEKLKELQKPQEVVSKDLKAIVLKTTEEVTNSKTPNKTEILKHLDKLALQIDNQQLVSYLSNSSCLYLPFEWDALENGSVELKKLKDDKFYCDINLTLKEYGEINLKLTLYEKNKLNLHFFSQSQKFKELVKQNLGSLRKALIDINITPMEMRIFEKKASPYETSQNTELNMGFEVKI